MPSLLLLINFLIFFTINSPPNILIYQIYLILYFLFLNNYSYNNYPYNNFILFFIFILNATQRKISEEPCHVLVRSSAQNWVRCALQRIYTCPVGLFAWNLHLTVSHVMLINVWQPDHSGGPTFTDLCHVCWQIKKKILYTDRYVPQSDH